jgi:tetratricopeptide (TPR) repeat protein
MDTNEPNSPPPDDATPPAIQGRVDVHGKVEGNVIAVNLGTANYHKHHHHHAPRPPIDPDQAQQLFERLPLDAVPEPAPLPANSRIQLPANPLFVGRENDLKALATTLKHGTTTVIAAATGMGGIGKTQLASEFAHRYGQYFAGGVYWLSFAEADGVESEIAACGTAMDLPGFAALEFPEQVARVRQIWQEAVPRLLIFDNCEDEALLREYRPKAGGSRVLVTSRQQQWSKHSLVTALQLGLLSRVESVALLRKYRDDLSQVDAEAIAQELGDLPLALSLAGGYLETYAEDAIGQPHLYLKNVRALLLKHRSLDQGERSVRASFELSFQRLESTNPTDALAIAALARAAHFAPGEPIPRKLLLASLGETTEDEDTIAQRADALKRLLNFGLLEDTGERTLRLHRLIAAFVLSVSNDDTAQAAVEQVLIDEGNKRYNSGYPAQLTPILAHLRHAQQRADPPGDVQAAELANALGRAEEMLTNYRAALPLLERALTIREQALGPEHPATATSLNNLAALYHAQGDYGAARGLYERALAIFERALGPQHPDTAQSLNNLANLLSSQGEYGAARPLYERALSINEQALGPAHPSTALSLNNLAALLESQGDYAAARGLYERALAIWEQALGPEHFHTAASLNNLAALLSRLGEYGAARGLYERALAIREQALGPQHPHTAQSLNNLAYLHQSQGEYEAARGLYERALSIIEQALGPQHPDTASSLNNLAGLYRVQGEYGAARELYERALAIREQALGPQHPDTATSLGNLAGLLQSQGEYGAARPLYERALVIREQALGSQHPDTATSLNNLAGLLCSQGEYRAARGLYERALAIREQALGPAHPDTATSLNNLAALLKSQGEYGAARPLYERALTIWEQALGPTHPDTATSLNNLAGVLESQGDYAAARPLYERALAIREQALGPAHPSTATSLNDLAYLLSSQGEYGVARPLYERALAIKEQALGPQHPDTAQSLNNLAHLYQSQGEYGAARPLYERALTICERSLGIEHPTTRTIRGNLAGLDSPRPSVAQQIAEITAQAQGAVAAALADSSIDRGVLAQQLEERARWAEDGEQPGSPYLALAAELRALIVQLDLPTIQQSASIMTRIKAAVFSMFRRSSS